MIVEREIFVRAVKRAIDSEPRADVASVRALWLGLMTGRWAVIGQLDQEGRRLVVAQRCRGRMTALSRREREVVALAGRGFANKAIAYALGLATSTVATHVGCALRKLGLGSRADLVRIAALGRQGAPDDERT